MSTSPAERNAAPAGPVLPTERIALLDILRGTALFGILLVNFNEDYFPAPVAAIDRITQAAIQFFCEGSFYPLFAFLFGLGFVLQTERMHARGAPVVRTYLRRLIGLFAIGTAHAVFFWPGDILRFYAVLAVPLLLLRRAPRGVLVAAIGLCFFLAIKSNIVPAAVRLSPTLARWTTLEHGPGPSERNLLGPVERQAIQGTSYSELVKVRNRIVWLQDRRALADPTMGLFLAMFLLGLIVGRAGQLQQPLAVFGPPQRVIPIALAVGAVGNFVGLFGPSLAARGISIAPPRVLDFSGVFQIVGDPAFSLAYGATITLLVDRSEAWRRRFSWLGQVGRMGLTNYLLQSVVMLFLMCGFGLGLAFRISLFASIPLKVALFAGQVWLSRWWMRRFRFGPAEWLWRGITYGTFPEFRLRRSIA